MLKIERLLAERHLLVQGIELTRALANSAPELVALVKAAKELVAMEDRFVAEATDGKHTKIDDLVGDAVEKTRQAIANLQQRPEWGEE